MHVMLIPALGVSSQALSFVAQRSVNQYSRDIDAVCLFCTLVSALKNDALVWVLEPHSVSSTLVADGLCCYEPLR
jgi:hypothetical protein